MEHFLECHENEKNRIDPQKIGFIFFCSKYICAFFSYFGVKYMIWTCSCEIQPLYILHRREQYWGGGGGGGCRVAHEICVAESTSRIPPWLIIHVYTYYHVEILKTNILSLNHFITSCLPLHLIYILYHIGVYLCTQYLSVILFPSMNML